MHPFAFLRQATITLLVAAAIFSGGMLPAAHAAAPVSVSQPDTFTASLRPHPALLSGQSATHLASGDWLIVGGDAAGQAGNLAWRISKDGSRQPLSSTLNLARTGHSATLLADGKVLIAGGVDAAGKTLEDAELFDPV